MASNEIGAPTHGPFPAQQPATHALHASWRYDDRGWTRDLRIDFLRGFVFVLLFTSHFPFFSWFSLIGWERLGVISSAEMFILLSGIVTGAVYGKRLKTDGLDECTVKLLKRSWTLYKTAVIAAGIVALLRLLPWLDMTALTTFTDPVTGKVYPLYPPLDAGFLSNLFHVLVLAASPHQFQIVGLYVVLFILTPFLFWAIDRAWTVPLLILSWVCYFINVFTPETQPGTAEITITVGQFEYAFPLIAWQVLFVHGVVVGYFRRQIMDFFATVPGRALIALCILLSLALMAFSLNHPLEQMPSWSKLSIVPSASFDALYHAYFLKYKLGFGRIVNITALLVSGMALLTVAWKPIHKWLGWLFIPLGQESMYVFFMHLFLILLVFNTPLPDLDNVWLNTALHAAAILTCWIMVKTRFLFRWVPH
ncbi:OpgC domain-containing protein [Noviherbaspirillum pedocola]|uniref:OpgC domain-containing protein n=1 Tax=Noviherbaspirillum pedocola TaxID=2801341 RepID=A0A934SUG9_9BURK|nr:OpgC domain-containing protein [Noviherbaspirillum pedocola]MBK4735396.1 OpgC domain-containing protein [Noviherbaspirillum pedocola]